VCVSRTHSHTHTHGTCEELCIEHVDGLVVPGILTLQVDGVQKVLDEGRQHHGHQDGILEGTERKYAKVSLCVCVCVCEYKQVLTVRLK